MPAFRVFTAKAATGRSTAVNTGGSPGTPITAFLANMTYGSTPTFTVTLDGSFDGGANWLTGTGSATGTFTTGTPQTLQLPTNIWYPLVSLNISANTNVTTIDAWIGYPSNTP